MTQQTVLLHSNTPTTPHERTFLLGAQRRRRHRGTVARSPTHPACRPRPPRGATSGSRCWRAASLVACACSLSPLAVLREKMCFVIEPESNRGARGSIVAPFSDPLRCLKGVLGVCPQVANSGGPPRAAENRLASARQQAIVYRSVAGKPRVSHCARQQRCLPHDVSSPPPFHRFGSRRWSIPTRNWRCCEYCAVVDYVVCEASAFRGPCSQGLLHMARTEGLHGLMKGNWTNCLRIIPNSAIKFLTYEKLKQYDTIPGAHSPRG